MTQITLPWRIDKDNQDAIEIVDGAGDLVFIIKHSDIPVEIRADHAERLISKCRTNFYAAVNAVNQIPALVGALEETLQVMRDLRGVAFVGSRSQRQQDPLLQRANNADNKAREVLSLSAHVASR